MPIPEAPAAFLCMEDASGVAVALRAQTALLQATLESSPNGILVVDGQMKKVVQNRRLNELFKIPPGVAEDPDDTKQIEFVAKLAKNPEQFSERVAWLYAHPEESAREEIELVDGTVLDRNTAPILGQDGEYYGRIWTFSDITERKRHEQEVERMNRLYAVLSQVNQAVVRSQSAQEVFDRVCRAALTYGGFELAWIGWLDPETRAVKPVASSSRSSAPMPPLHIFADESVRGRGPTGTAIREGRTVISNDLMQDADAATWRSLATQWEVRSAAAFPIRVRDQVSGALVLYAKEAGFFRKHEVMLLEEAASDVSFALEVLENEAQRSQAERALQESVRQLEESRRIARLGVYTFEVPEDRWSSSTLLDEIFGISAGYPHTAAGWLKLVHPDDGEMMRRHLQDEVLALRQRFDKEYRIVRPSDGEERWVHGLGELITGNGGRPTWMMGTIQDITDRKRLEMQLRQAQKLEAVGQLAGGVAHDFNNILAAQYLHLGLLQQREGLSGEVSESLAALETGARMASDLTRQLLAFSRRQVLQVQRLDFDRVISNLLKMLRRVLGEDITLRFEPALNPLWLDADPGMMEQVVMNLVVNARDAMPKGGHLIIRTEEALIAEGQPFRHPDARPGRFIRLTVADTGLGMTPEVQQRIFEPFFTTKALGKGTGLGLATVFGIVTQHQGWIEVESQVGAGTTFRVYYPAVNKPEAAATGGRKQDGLPGGSETILLVEDEKTVRFTLRRALERLGYRVLEAGEAGEANRHWVQHASEIRLLITDMIMPGGINGLQLAERLQAQAPGLRVIVCSGYSQEVVNGQPVFSNFRRLAKPFELRRLAEAIRQELDRR